MPEQRSCWKEYSADFHILVADVFRVGKLFFEYKNHYLHSTNSTVLVIGSVNGDISLKYLVTSRSHYLIHSLIMSVAEEE